LDKVIVLDHNESPFLNEEPVKLFHDESNPGFARGMNWLIRRALKENLDCFIGLTNDLVLREGSITNLFSGLQETDATVVQGTLISESDRILTARHRLNRFFHWSHNLDRHRDLREIQDRKHWDTDFVCGAFFAVNLVKFRNRPVFFDEDFYLYHEDIEWSLRLKQNGHKISVLSHALASHGESQATGGGLTKEGMRLRWPSLKTYLRKTRRSFLYRFMSVAAFWMRMLLVWRKDGCR
jgi:hypothetical protein